MMRMVVVVEVRGLLLDRRGRHGQVDATQEDRTAGSGQDASASTAATPGSTAAAGARQRRVRKVQLQCPGGLTRSRSINNQLFCHTPLALRRVLQLFDCYNTAGSARCRQSPLAARRSATLIRRKRRRTICIFLQDNGHFYLSSSFGWIQAMAL